MIFDFLDYIRPLSTTSRMAMDFATIRLHVSIYTFIESPTRLFVMDCNVYLFGRKMEDCKTRCFGVIGGRSEQ